MNLSDRSLITVSGGLQNCRGAGASEVLPLQKGAEEILALLQGGGRGAQLHCKNSV